MQPCFKRQSALSRVESLIEEIKRRTKKMDKVERCVGDAEDSIIQQDRAMLYLLQRKISITAKKH